MNLVSALLMEMTFVVVEGVLIDVDGGGVVVVVALVVAVAVVVIVAVVVVVAAIAPIAAVAAVPNAAVANAAFTVTFAAGPVVVVCRHRNKSQLQ